MRLQLSLKRLQNKLVIVDIVFAFAHVPFFSHFLEDDHVSSLVVGVIRVRSDEASGKWRQGYNLRRERAENTEDDASIM